MPTLRLTRAREFYPFFNFMRKHGIPVESYLEKHRIPTCMVEIPDLYIDESRFWRLSDELARREHLPDFGFQVGQQMQLQDIDEIGALLQRQASLMQALRTFCTFARAEALGSAIELERRGEDVWLSVRNRGGREAHSDIIELYNMELFKRVIESAVGGRWTPSALELRAHSLPAGLCAEELSTGAITFGSSRTAILIPASMLSRSTSNYDLLPEPKSTGSVPTEYSFADGVDFTTQLRLLMKGYLGEDLKLHELAELLHLSERSLQRRLTESGTSFRQLQAEARLDLARHLLEHTDASVTEISFNLGYTHPNNFGRFFYTWTGVSPRYYRRLRNYGVK